MFGHYKIWSRNLTLFLGTWGLIYKHSVHTKQGLKEAHVTSHTKVVMYKDRLDGRNSDPCLQTFWRGEIGDA